MKFMMIVKGNKDYEAGKPPNPVLMAEISKHSEEAAKKGILLSSGGLLPSSKGARIHVAGGKLTVTDGPFTEVKELVGGFAIMQANSKEEAIAMGTEFMKLHVKVLGASYEGQLEIREMFDDGKGCAGDEHETARSVA
jgi:hypothetical protein